MPLYEFLCRKCGSHFEALTRLGGEKSVACKACGSQDVRKLLSTFGIGGGSSRLTSSSSACTTCSTKSCGTCRP